jgi:hypothetical protein
VIVIDAGVMMIVGGYFLGMLIAQVAMLYGIDEWVADGISWLILFCRREHSSSLNLSPAHEQALMEMARMLGSFGLTRQEIETGCRRMAELQKKVGL